MNIRGDDDHSAFDKEWEKIRNTMPPGQMDFNQLSQMKQICQHFYATGWNGAIDAVRGLRGLDKE